jgi:hypothetical protein
MKSVQVKVGDIASNVESDWTGQIIGFETHNVGGSGPDDPGDVMAVMLGISDWFGAIVLDEDDKQWHDVRDLELVRKGTSFEGDK